MAQRQLRFVLVALVAAGIAACTAGASSPAPSPVPTALPSASPTAMPSLTSIVVPSESPVVDLPMPSCPAPETPVVPPVVSTSSGHGQVIAATPGSYTTITCSTSGSADVEPTSPTGSLAAYPGDTITLAVPVGWRFIRWEGSHAPLHATGGGGIWPSSDLPAAARSIRLPDGPLLQDETVRLTVVLMSDDDRAVIELGLEFDVNRSVS